MAYELDISHAHISKLETGKANPSYHLLVAIEHIFGISVEWLQRETGPMMKPGWGTTRVDDIPCPLVPSLHIVPDGPSKMREPNQFVSMPLFEDAAAAGIPLIVRDEMIEGYAVVDASQLQHGRHVALRVSGDSMKPIINSGDIVAVNRDRRDPRQLLGRIVVAKVDEGVTIKYLFEGRRGSYILQPENREHRSVDVVATDLKIIGCVEWAWKKLD